MSATDLMFKIPLQENDLKEMMLPLRAKEAALLVIDAIDDGKDGKNETEKLYQIVFGSDANGFKTLLMDAESDLECALSTLREITRKL